MVMQFLLQCSFCPGLNAIILVTWQRDLSFFAKTLRTSPTCSERTSESCTVGNWFNSTLHI